MVPNPKSRGLTLNMTSFLATKGQTTLLTEQVNAHSQRRLDRRHSWKKKRNRARMRTASTKETNVVLPRNGDAGVETRGSPPAGRCHKYIGDVTAVVLEVTQRRKSGAAWQRLCGYTQADVKCLDKQRLVKAHNFAQGTKQIANSRIDG